jgi:hypothetical protein
MNAEAPSLASIASLESLREHLQWAIELEHFTLPQVRFRICPSSGSRETVALSGTNSRGWPLLHIAGLSLRRGNHSRRRRSRHLFGHVRFARDRKSLDSIIVRIRDSRRRVTRRECRGQGFVKRGLAYATGSPWAMAMFHRHSLAECRGPYREAMLTIVALHGQ